MADDYRRGRGDPPRDNPGDLRYAPASEGQDPRAPPPGASASTSLPPISHPAPAPAPTLAQPDQRYQERGYPADPRYQSDPRSWPPDGPVPNGYPPQADPRYLPPFPPQDPRQYDDRREYEDRRQYDDRRPYDDQRPYDGQRQYNDQRQYMEQRPYDSQRQFEDQRLYNDQRAYEDQRQYSDRRAYPDPYYDAQQAAQGRGGGYGPDYYRYPPAPYPYVLGPPPPLPPQQQSAPRQRTSIACRYCRKRKIRCSGYAHTTNGKCANCDKLRIDCIFQPVSSNSSTAFVPVSAVPGGVPPGTPLYGAYGQPLPPAGAPAQAPAPQARTYPSYPPSELTPPLQSPMGGYPPSLDEKDPSGRRRTRPPDEEHSPRPPPPNYPVDDDPRRRSPAASMSSNGTASSVYQQPYQQGQSQSPYDRNRPPTPRQTSPGGGPPPPPQLPAQAATLPQLQLPPQPPTQQPKNPMSLDNLIGLEPRSSVHDIDQSMLGRLNRGA
ncbi:hypothetical protein VTK56DRAFT_8387 [Thermocarpiscus australiensis]